MLRCLLLRGPEALELCKVALKNGANPKIVVEKNQNPDIRKRTEMQQSVILLQKDWPNVKLVFLQNHL